MLKSRRMSQTKKELSNVAVNMKKRTKLSKEKVDHDESIANGTKIEGVSADDESTCAVPQRESCPFCSRWVLKLSRHVTSKHAEEPKVQRILSLPKLSSERRKLCQKLRLGDDFEKKKSSRYIPKDEKNFCLYCGIACAKVVRHFSTKHPDETQVRSLLSLPVRSERRIALAADLRQKGNEKHSNTSIKREFFPCEHCGGTFRRSILSRHKQKCSKKDDLIQLEPVSDETKSLFKTQVLDTMAKDDLSMIIHADSMICEYGVHLFSPGRKKSTLVALKRKIRLMAKFLEAMMHRNGDVECVHQILHPSYFKDVLHCAKKVFNYCPKTDTFKNIFSSYYVAQGLRFCAQFEQRRLTLDGRSDKSIKNFLKQLETRVCSKVSRTGPKQYLPPEHRLNKVAEDVIYLADYLLKESIRLEGELREGEKPPSDPELLLRLLKVTLSAMMLLNASSKRLVETVTLDDYNNLIHSSPTKEEEEDLNQLLTRDLYKLSKESKGEAVTLILTEDLKNAIDLSLQVRESLGVNVNNPFVFPRVYHSSLFSLKGSICLKESVRLAGFKEEPTNLLSSQLDRAVALIFNIIYLPFSVHRPFLNVINGRSKTNLGAIELSNSGQIAYIVSLLIECEEVRAPNEEE